jgi:hypothetical protein
MQDFDIHFSMNGMESELSQFKDVQSQLFIEPQNSFDGNETISVNNVNVKDKNWVDTLNQFTQEFKNLSDFKTNEQIRAEKQQELAEKGTKYKVLGMNPFVAIGLSFAVIIGGSIVLTKIKAG